MRLRARLSFAAAALLLGFVLFAEPLLRLLSPFLAAFFLVAVLDPLVNQVEKMGLPRGLGAFLGIAGLGLGFVGFSWMVISNLIREAELLKIHLPEYGQQTKMLMNTLVTYVSTFMAGIPHPLDDAIQQGSKQVADLLATLTSQVVTKVSGIPGFIFMSLVTLTTTYFLSRDKRRIGQFILSLVPLSWHEEIRRLQDEIITGLFGFVRAQVILIGVSAVLSIVGLIIFGIRYAWILGTFAGILDIVPMVGPSGVFIPVILWHVITAEWAKVFGLCSVWMAILLIRQLLEPQVIGRQVGLHPITSIASMYLGALTFGMNGIIIGPILAITVKAICVVSIFPYLVKE